MRELVVLGTAGQVPTRTRAQNGCFLRWDGEGVLLDPGEGTQRQLTLAGIAASSITRICITHFHGDHCFGLPGVLQRLALDRIAHPVFVHFPAEHAEIFEHLRSASFAPGLDLRVEPVERDGVVAVTPGFTLSAQPLEHRCPTYGWRLEEPSGRRMLPERLDALGITGADIGRLQRGEASGRVRLEDVSEARRGQVFAFVMDTRLCDAAISLAKGADIVVCESTFLSSDEVLARDYAHLTAAQAARVAREAGARELVLTHYSQRYSNESVFQAEARTVFADSRAARDLTRVEFPPRRGTY